jgi:hypothetical protein
MSKLIRKSKEKGEFDLRLESVSPKEIARQMDKLLRHYGANRSQSDLEKTRQILTRVGSLNEELRSMRDEER